MPMQQNKSSSNVIFAEFMDAEFGNTTPERNTDMDTGTEVSSVTKYRFSKMYHWMISTRDEMGGLLGTMAQHIYDNPEVLHDLEIIELVRLYDHLYTYPHWCVSANVIHLATGWVYLRLLELQEQLDTDLGLGRQSKEEIELHKQELRKAMKDNK